MILIPRQSRRTPILAPIQATVNYSRRIMVDAHGHSQPTFSCTWHRFWFCVDGVNPQI